METKRVNIYAINPEAFKPLFALGAYLDQSSLTKEELALIKIRASQLNACAYCIQMHVRVAVEEGIAQFRIHAIGTWRETSFFSQDEALILQMTEELTKMDERGLTDETYVTALEHFGEEKVVHIIMATVTINSWNRVARATLMIPEAAQS